MAYAARSTDFHRHIASKPLATGSKAPARTSFLSRLFSAFIESREQEATRNVRAYLARTGGRFTDSIEREINDRLFSGNWNPHR